MNDSCVTRSNVTIGLRRSTGGVLIAATAMDASAVTVFSSIVKTVVKRDVDAKWKTLITVPCAMSHSCAWIAVSRAANVNPLFVTDVYRMEMTSMGDVGIADKRHVAQNVLRKVIVMSECVMFAMNFFALLAERKPLVGSPYWQHVLSAVNPCASNVQRKHVPWRAAISHLATIHAEQSTTARYTKNSFQRRNRRHEVTGWVYSPNSEAPSSCYKTGRSVAGIHKRRRIRTRSQTIVIITNHKSKSGIQSHFRRHPP